MSYVQQGQSIHQFVPNYVVKSDYLPARVTQGNNPQAAQLLRQYEEEKRRGRVFTSRPAEFNPNRYASFKVSEAVLVDRPLDQQNFSRVVRR